MNDLIVEEVRQARSEIAAEFDYDLPKYHAWLQEQQTNRKLNCEIRVPDRHILVKSLEVLHSEAN